MSTRLIVVGLSALLVTTSALGGSQKALELDGTHWIFEANSLVDVWVEPIGNKTLTLEFKDGRVNGYAGCNRFFGPYIQKGHRLKLGSLGSTRMICDDEIQHQEDVILEALEKVSSFEIIEVLMHMNTGGGTSIVYRRDEHGKGF